MKKSNTSNRNNSRSSDVQSTTLGKAMRSVLPVVYDLAIGTVTGVAATA